MRLDGMFCDFEDGTVESFEAIKYTNFYPKGSVLYLEGHPPRGIFVLCSGRVKLSSRLNNNKTRIMHIAEEGEVLGLSPVLSGRDYEATAETLCPVQVNFVRRDDFLKFLSQHGDACVRVAQQLSASYHDAFNQIRTLALSQPASERLAKLLVQWSEEGEQTSQGIVVELHLTQEEIAQLIGTSRETVTRLLGEFKNKNLIHVKGSTMLICDRPALSAITEH
jgi:CRP/FNR family transcriptional regulator, cyclic AMP receptor protein